MTRGCHGNGSLCVFAPSSNRGISSEDSGAARDLRGGCDVCVCVRLFDVPRSSAGVIEEVSSAAS